jgi:hypothetical protein
MVLPAPLTDQERIACCNYRFEGNPSLQVPVTNDVRSYAGSAMYTYSSQLN